MTTEQLAATPIEEQQFGKIVASAVARVETEGASNAFEESCDKRPEGDMILRLYSQKRSKEGLEMLVTRYRSIIQKIVTRRLRLYEGYWPVAHSAEDITHDALIRIHTHFERKSDVLEIRNLGGYIYKFVIATIADRRRKEAGRTASLCTLLKNESETGMPTDIPIVDSSADIFGEVAGQLCLEDFEESLSHLNLRSQQAIRFFLEGYKLHETADMMSMTISGVAAAKLRGLTQIVKELKQKGWNLDEMFSPPFNSGFSLVSHC